jgi:glucose/arabinose dehydrogenase
MAFHRYGSSLPSRAGHFLLWAGAFLWAWIPLQGRAAGGLGLKLIAEGLTSPTVLVEIPDGSGRRLVADQVGVIRVLNEVGVWRERPFLDVRDRLAKLNQGFDERGLLGLALHPRFRENRKLYVYYSAPLRVNGPEDWDHTGRLSEFKTKDAELSEADPASERVLLEVDEPYFNHNSGRLAFGPDGFLYVALGDGGNANDIGRGHSPIGNGQDLTTWLGKILRIDVDHGTPYAIPGGNPFQDGKARSEIFAYGLRNPWGMTFDRGGGHELFVADVGQTMFEEVNIVTQGGNYGWFIREGRHCFDPKSPKSPPANCPKVGADGKPLLEPILEYKNVNGFRKDAEALGVSVIGGYVYRGKAMPSLQGSYLFADWSRNWAVPDGVLLKGTPQGEGSARRWSLEPLPVDNLPGGKLGAYIVALAEDAAGELYVLTNGRNSLTGTTGKVYKLIPQ